MNYRETTVNGIRVNLWGQRQSADLAARRAAAALPRGADIRHVESDTDGGACIWFEPGTGPAGAISQDIPDGWTVESFDLFGDGTLAVEVEEEGQR